MKIDRDTFDRLRAAIEPLDTAEVRAAYAPPAKVKDKDRAYRWALLWASVDTGAITYAILHGYDDAHIDTALRRIVPPLGVTR